MPARSIGDAIRRAREYLALRPAEARYTDTAAVARIESGLRCRVEGPGGTAIVTVAVRGHGKIGGSHPKFV